ncbi:hypothetical protein IWX63_002976 [Arthrobacter sp. CAN_A2]
MRGSPARHRSACRACDLRVARSKSSRHGGLYALPRVGGGGSSGRSRRAIEFARSPSAGQGEHGSAYSHHPWAPSLRWLKFRLSRICVAQVDFARAGDPVSTCRGWPNPTRLAPTVEADLAGCRERTNPGFVLAMPALSESPRAKEAGVPPDRGARGSVPRGSDTLRPEGTQRGSVRRSTVVPLGSTWDPRTGAVREWLPTNGRTRARQTTVHHRARIAGVAATRRVDGCCTARGTKTRGVRRPG